VNGEPPAADPGRRPSRRLGAVLRGPGRAGPGGLQGLPRVPLRITLVALLVALVAVGLVATGAAATSLLRTYLAEQQDIQLRTSVTESVQSPGLLNACTDPGLQRLSAQTYLACLTPLDDDLVVVAGPRTDEQLPSLDTDDVAALLGRAPQPLTVPSADGRTSWRIAAGSVQVGGQSVGQAGGQAGGQTGGQASGQVTVLAGIDLAQDRAITARLVTLQVVVGLIVLTILGVAGYLLVRNSLRPLEEVEHTAAAIAAGDLSQRVPAGDHRTEVGRLSTALNGMLARIESAFRAQKDSEEQARASEEQARASEEQARASEARMRRFVADASHELRTPLTSIRGFAELYRQGAVGQPADVRKLMQRIEAEAARMGLLVEDLLQLARVDQQRPLSLVPVDLAEVAGDVVHDARAVQPERPVTLHLDDSLTDVPVVLGDEARLRQVVGNLVTNALVHTPRDARVQVTLAEDEPDSVLVRVTDEGPGMAPEDAERVFERFYRADTSRTRAAGGTGLGLAIVASLVAAHGGTVHLDTAPGQGAAFTVRLPRSGPPARAARDGAPPADAAPPPSAPPPSAPAPSAQDPAAREPAAREPSAQEPAATPPWPAGVPG
jgi:two-component system OmpR family sensor kinase